MAKGGYVSMINGLPLWAKILLSLPIVNGIVFGIYRICTGHLVAGVLWFFFGSTLLWVVDLITIILKGKPILWAE